MKKSLPGSILIASLVMLTMIAASGDSTDDAKTVAALDTEYQAAVKLPDSFPAPGCRCCGDR
jgi:hypothetical protein